MSVAHHFFSVVNPWLYILVFYWLYEGVIFILTGFFPIIPQVTLKFCAPKIVSTGIIVPSVVCGWQAALFAFEVGNLFSNLLIAGGFKGGVEGLRNSVFWAIYRDIYGELSFGCFLNEPIKGIWDLSLGLKISLKWCTFLDKLNYTLYSHFTH